MDAGGAVSGAWREGGAARWCGGGGGGGGGGGARGSLGSADGHSDGVGGRRTA